MLNSGQEFDEKFLDSKHVLKVYFKPSRKKNIFDFTTSYFACLAQVSPLNTVFLIPQNQCYPGTPCTGCEVFIRDLKSSIICQLQGNNLTYHKVLSSKPVYYSILDHFVLRSQYMIIQFPLHKQSENSLV